MPFALSPKWRLRVLNAAVFLDLFAVSLVVPLLPIRMRELGLDPATIGMMGSIYSVSQMVGGVLMGAMADRVLGRRGVLLLSFLGAAASYSLVGMASSVWMLLVSRVVVGLVKQTMTVSSALAAEWSSNKNRASAMGAISSMATFAWVTGSGIGAYVARLHPSAPCVLAVTLYGLDAILVLTCLPDASIAPTADASEAKVEKRATDGAVGPPGRADDKKDDKRGDKDHQRAKTRPGFVESVRRAFGNRTVAAVIGFRLGYMMVARASYSSVTTWENETFNLDMSSLGFLSTWKSVASVVMQGVVVGRLIRRLGERQALVVAMVLGVVNGVMEGTIHDFFMYAAFCTPVKLLSGTIAELGLKSLFTQAVPLSELSSALAVVDVLGAGIGVVAPLAGGLALQYGGLAVRPWLFASGYLVLLLALLAGLLPAPAPEAAVPNGEDAQAKKVQ